MGPDIDRCIDEVAEDSLMDIIICSDDLFLDVIVEKMGLYDKVAPYLGLIVSKK